MIQVSKNTKYMLHPQNFNMYIDFLKIKFPSNLSCRSYTDSLLYRYSSFVQRHVDPFEIM